MRFTPPKPKVVPVKFAGHDLFVTEWTAGVREEFERKVNEMLAKKTFRAFMLSISLVDADGKPVVENWDDITNMPYSEVHPVMELISQVNLLRQDVIDELEKN